MSDGPMSPEEYARFMGHGMDDEESGAEKKETKSMDQKEIDRIRVGLKQCGVSNDNIAVVMKDIDQLGLGEQREFNFIRGHVRRVRIRRELSGQVSMITY